MAFFSESITDNANIAQLHAVENAKPFDKIEFEKVLQKKFAGMVEDYDSLLGAVQETSPEAVLPKNSLPDEATKSSQK